MLIVCNGNTKSGSTWLVEITKSIGRWGPIPTEWQNPDWINSSLDPRYFDEFVRATPWRNQNIYIKQHWTGDERYRDLLRHDDVKMLNIVRDIRDVLISRYFHDVRIGKTGAQDVNEYYASGRGRQLMQVYMDYHNFWHSESEPHPCLATYEGMKADFEGEAKRILEYLSVSASGSMIRELAEKTSFTKKKSAGSTHHRKGVVGDWQNHLNQDTLSDLMRLCRERGFTYRIAEGVDA